MASMNQLMTALKAADAAGNTADAQRIAQIIKGLQSQPQQQGTDGAFAYGVDRAQQLAGKGIEVVGDLFGSETIKQTGSDIVAQQEQDIAAGGYQPTYTGSLSDTYKEGGISAALGWIGEKTAENAASGGVAIAGTAAAALTAPFSAPAALVLGGGTLAGSALMGAGEAAMEQEDKTGDYNSATAACVGVLVGILDRFGAGKVIPKSKLANMTGEQVVDALMKAGKPNAAAAVGRRIAGSTLGEAGTEVAQDAAIVGSTAAMGGEYTGEELADRALESAVIGGTIGGGTRTAIETAGAAGRGVRAAGRAITPSGFQPSDPQAAADLANRLQAIANRDDIDLKNIDLTDTKGARAAVDQAHKEITGDLKSLRRAVLSNLTEADGDSDQVRADKIAIQRGFDNARTKTKNTVGSAELEALQRLLGNTQEGQQIANLWRQSNELTELHNRGYKGGISRFTDALSPIGNPGYSDRSLIEIPTRLGLTGAAAGVTGGASIPAQLGAVAAGRGIDALTGRRSAVAKFVRDQQAQQGTADPTGQSIRASRALAKQQQEEREAAEKQRKRDLAMEATRRNDPAKGDPNDPNPSPQFTMESAAGLTRTGVARALRIIIRIRPDLADAAEGYKRMLITGEPSGDLTPLIRAVKGVVRNSPETFEDVRTDQPPAEPQTESDDRRARGKAANMKEIARLQREVNDSNGISMADKALLNQALETLKQPLGADPVAAAQSIVDETQANLTKPELADKYLGPYVKRIVRQQKKSKK